ncbi:uncharacterized protein J4E92_010672 [Alternaria infectoria]|uniref:uncharacterized protein n=1 Tax=Alternaria infectoria TaxID=45303 RepID=UPI00221FB7EC|nr:uncharacterized protein J4E92_010672 [Alternaria infectoria]KAI4909207.1 hypothetical protein J4E92_010672 [Alternaria infectoria]
MQPIADHHNALLSEVVAQANRALPLAQPEHDASHQYPAQDPWRTNSLNATAFDVYRPGSFNPSTGFYDGSLNLQYGDIDLGLAFQLPPVYPSNDVYDQFQPMMPTMDWNQPTPLFQPTPAPAGLTTPAPAPTTDAASIRCPEGCPETFGRNEEMRRHMKKHGTPRFKCPIYDCPMTFYRKDKLKDHAKKGHGSRASLNIR